MRALAADALVIFGLVIVTVGVYGVLRLPDVFTQLHAASKAAFLGILALLLAASLGGDAATIGKSVLVAALLTVTTPVAAHVIAQAALIRGEGLDTPGALDESGLARDDATPPGGMRGGPQAEDGETGHHAR
jgi:multicomponent Na+:H+ antiporter subunit G